MLSATIQALHERERAADVLHRRQLADPWQRYTDTYVPHAIIETEHESPSSITVCGLTGGPRRVWRVALIALGNEVATMEGMRTEATTIPSAAVAEEAREALRALVRVVQGEGEARVSLHTAGEPNGVTVTLPREAIELFVEVLGQMANGNAVTVVPVYAELTTHQAAEILNVSRPYLIGLLDACKIPFRMVGTHRRVRFTDLMAYKQQDDARRDEALAELTRQAQDLGLGY